MKTTIIYCMILAVSCTKKQHYIQAQRCPDLLPASHDGSSPIIFKRPNHPPRHVHIYTSTKYDPSKSSSKVIFAFHGWGGSGREWMSIGMKNLANRFNAIIVAPTGLRGSGPKEYNSWQNYGSNTGFDESGTKPTCDISQKHPNFCYDSCAPCANRCSWTHCLDDDIVFVRDLIQGGANFENALPDVICFEPSQVFVMGSSNGGMFTWTLLQDDRTAELFRAAAPVIGLPHCGYNFANRSGIKTPVLLMTGKKDRTVSPSKLPWPGKSRDKCVRNRDGDGYDYVAAHTIVSTWARGSGGECRVRRGRFPTRKYNAGKNLECKTWCVGTAPYAVDCAFDGGHIHPQYVNKAAFRFFEAHATCKKKGQSCGSRKDCCAGCCFNQLCTR